MNDPIADLNDVHVYQQDSHVLTNASLKLFQGEFVYLIGKTGAGKTTLLKALYGALPIHSGSGTVLGYNLLELKKKEIPFLRRRLGMIFQDFQLLTDRTVFENLRFVLKATGWRSEELITKRIDEVLTQVGLHTKAHKMPYELSGGEQQRVSTGRALLNDPKLILADEPTGNLDPDTATEIIELLFSIKNTGSTILMATHNYKIIDKYPSRIVKIENGECIEVGKKN